MIYIAAAAPKSHPLRLKPLNQSRVPKSLASPTNPVDVICVTSFSPQTLESQHGFFSRISLSLPCAVVPFPVYHAVNILGPMSATGSPNQPSLPWRTGSSLTMGVAGALSRIFVHGASSTEVHGLGWFLELLDKRRDIDRRERGLLTSMLRQVFQPATVSSTLLQFPTI